MYIGNVHPNEFYKDKPEVLKKFNAFMKKEGIEYADRADDSSLPNKFHIFGSCCGSGGTIICGDKQTHDKLVSFFLTAGNSPSGLWHMKYHTNRNLKQMTY